MDTVELLKSFAQLRRAWALSPRAKGGVWALAGFEFQLAKALLELIRAADGGQPLVFVEAISDLVKADGGLVIAQAKRTLSSGAISSALEELWSIDGLIRQTTPELTAVVRYEIHSARRSIADAKGSLERWEPSVAGDEFDLVEFKKRVAFDTTASPRLAAAKLLLDRYKVKEALNTVNKYLGWLLAAAAQGDFDQVTAEIVQDLDEHRARASETERRLGLWGDDDQPPKTTTRETDVARAVRVGERLTPLDLREGRLAWRGLYESLWQAVERVLESAGPSAHLPAVWLEGRSGTGKSAALLHVTARLYAEDPQRVILWLGPHSERVGEAIRWAVSLLREGRQVILAVDDPCSAERQHRFVVGIQEAFDEWQSALGAGPTIGLEDLRPPLLLCCGPVEQRHTAETLAASELQIHPLPLPKETSEDLEELAVWYRERTGRDPLPYEGEVLLVQRFFEWSNGRLQAFAARFKSRLQDFDRHREGDPVLDLVSSVLALGRLYADFPEAGLRAAFEHDPDTESAFFQLSKEEAHFAFSPSGEAGVRLTHPHLADAIYREWYGFPKDAPRRREHLRQGLASTGGQGEPDPSLRTAPLWAISRIIDPRIPTFDPDLRGRVALVRDELIDVLRDLYPRVIKRGTPFTDLPVWIGLSDEFDLGLDPDPSARLRALVNDASAPERGLRLSAHRLLQHASQTGDQTAADSVASMLNRLVEWREGSSPWPEWPWIAIDYMRRFGTEALRAALIRLVELSSDWRPLAHVMEVVLSGEPASEDVALGLAWLRRASPQGSRWPNVLQAVLKGGAEDRAARDLVLKFLEARPEYYLWPALWQSLLEKSDLDVPRLLAMGRGWLGLDEENSSFYEPTNVDNAGYDRVWAGVWRRSEADREELRAIGRAWLDTAPTNYNWSRVWQELWADAESRGAELNDLTNLALAWLNRPEANAGWSYVWEILAKAADAPLRARLSDLGTAWLEGANQEHLGWGFVWQLEYENASDDPDRLNRLTALADAWLSDPGGTRNGWTYLWRLLRDKGVLSTERLYELALQWLDAGGSPSRWPIVYAALENCDDERLAEWGAKRLATLDTPGWASIFATWAKRVGDGDEVGHLALRWLKSKRDDDPVWGLVWSTAIDLATENTHVQELTAAADMWLPTHPKHAGWPSVWLGAQKLPGHRPVGADLDAGLNWLSATEHFPKGWGRVWLFVMSGQQLLPTTLLEPTFKWLSTAKGSVRTWLEVLDRLRSFAPSEGEASIFIELLDRRMQNPLSNEDDWYKYWRARVDLDPPWWENGALVSATLAWARRPNCPGNLLAYIASTALKVIDEPSATELRGLALAWLTRHPPTANGWDPLWRLVGRHVTNASDGDAILNLAAGAIASPRLHSEAWLRLWQVVGLLPLDEGPRCRAEDLAVERLRSRMAHPTWPTEFWRFSAIASPRNVVVLAAEWLKASRADDDPWIAVWRRARARTDAEGHASLNALLLAALDRLEVPKVGSVDVLQYVNRKNPPEAILRLAAAWLENADWPEWPRAWDLLQRKAPSLLDDPTVRAYQDRWLTSGTTNQASWLQVMRHRLRHDPSVLNDSGLRAAATQWLGSHPDSSVWTFVAQSAVTAARGTSEDADLLVLVRSWLATHRFHGGWPFVWAALWRHEARTPATRAHAIAEGRKWLAESRPDALGRRLVVTRVSRDQK